MKLGIYTRSTFLELENHSLRKQCFPTSHHKIRIEGISETAFIEFVLKDLSPGKSYSDFVELLYNPSYQKSYLANLVLRKINGKAYYFNEDGKYTSHPLNDLKSLPNLKVFYGPGHYPVIWPNRTGKHIKQVTNLLHENDSFESFVELMYSSEISIATPKPRTVDDFIKGYSKPYVSRTNADNNTISDSIIINVRYPKYMTVEEVKDFITSHYSEIRERVYKKIESSPLWINPSNIPIRKLSNTWSINPDQQYIIFDFPFRVLINQPEKELAQQPQRPNVTDKADAIPKMQSREF